MKTVECAKCAKCCIEPLIPLNDYEVRKITRATGLLASKIVRFVPFEKVSWPKDSDDWVELREGRRIMMLRHHRGKCMFLKNRRCLIYNHRPRVCRLFPVDFDFYEDGDIYEVEIQKRISGCKADVAKIPEKDKDMARIACADFRADENYAQKVAVWNDENPRGTVAEFLAFIEV